MLLTPKLWGRLLVVGVLGAVVHMPSAGHAGSVSATRPMASADTALDPGLKVRYYSRSLSRLRELRDWIGYKKGKEGPPLPSLDYPETKGAVLTATQTDQVGANIEGAIRFSEAGTYRFKVLSNDGVQVDIAGKKLLKDDRPHKARFSEEGTVKVEMPGWYPIHVLYFEKNGNAALQLHWVTPSGSGYTVVPAEAFGH